MRRKRRRYKSCDSVEVVDSFINTFNNIHAGSKTSNPGL